MFSAECGLIARALTGFDDECGDTGVVVEEEDGVFVALIDVLGHGAEAYEVAELAKTFLIANHGRELVELMEALHEHLKGSRGAVATLGRFLGRTGELRVVGVGNIAARLFADQTLRVSGRDGIVGYSMPKPKSQEMHMLPGDVFLLYSDGVREQFDVFDRPGLFLGTAEEIARGVLDAFAKGDDDASCLVLRCRQ